MPSQYNFFQPKSGKKDKSNTVPRGSFNISPEHSSQGADSRVRRIKKESDEFVKAQRADPDAEFHKMFGGSGRAPSDPNDTGAKGTQMSVNPGKPVPNMTYESFMRDIGNKYGLQFAAPPLASSNLPATPGYGQSFMLNGKETPVTEMSAEDRFALDHTAGRTSQYMKGYKGDPSDPQAMMAWAINHGYTGTADVPGIKAQEMGATGGELAANMTLQAGLRTDAVKKAESRRHQPMRGMEDDDRFNNFDDDYGDLSHLTSDMRADSRAFLDEPDTAIGLRKAEAARNVIYQGQKHYTIDPSAKGGITEISRGAAREMAETLDMASARKNNPLPTPQQTPEIDRVPQNNQNPPVVGEDGNVETIDNEAALRVAGFAQDFANNAIAKTKEHLFK